jgi:hypothetical protein
MNELCKQCTDYKKCVGFPWYSWEDIKWCPYQVWWIIEFSDVFEQGIWPDAPENRHTDIVEKSLTPEASFVRASMALGEVEARLLRTDKDGEWLVSLIKSGYSLHLNREFRFDLVKEDGSKINFPLLPKLAFHYITGWDRFGTKLCPICKSRVKRGDVCSKHGKVEPIKEKRVKYSDWKKQRVYRGKKKNLTTKSNEK